MRCLIIYYKFMQNDMTTHYADLTSHVRSLLRSFFQTQSNPGEQSSRSPHLSWNTRDSGGQYLSIKETASLALSNINIVITAGD